MKKLLKWMGVIVGIFIVLVILAMGTLIVAVNPNRFKPLIVDQIKKHTGHPLTIDGDLSWTFFPDIGIKVGHLTVYNTPEFKQKIFADIKSFTVGVKLFPLLRATVESSGIRLEDMKLYLIKNTNGQTNWQQASQPSTQAHQETLPSQGAAKKTPFQLAIAGIDIANASISWLNEQTRQSIDINQLDLRVKNITLTQPILFETSFHFVGQTPSMSGKFSLTSQISFHPDKKSVALNHLTLSAMMDDKTLVVKELTGDFDLTSASHLQSFRLQGDVKVGEVQTSKMRLGHVNAKVTMQQGILSMAPITANFYQGSIQGETMIDMNASIPKLTIKAQLRNVQTEPLLLALAGDQKLKFASLGTVDLQVTTLAASQDVMIKNLEGTARLSLNDGVLQGIDIGYLVDSARSIVKGKSTSQSNTHQTPFGSVTANAVIHRGVISNNDLHLDASVFDTKGNGTLDLATQQINYHLQTTVKKAANQKEKWENFYGLPIPIDIIGSLQNPSIRLEMDALMKVIAQKKFKKTRSEVESKIQEKIKEKLPKKANEFIKNLLGS